MYYKVTMDIFRFLCGHKLLYFVGLMPRNVTAVCVREREKERKGEGEGDRQTDTETHTRQSGRDRGIIRFVFQKSCIILLSYQ